MISIYSNDGKAEVLVSHEIIIIIIIINVKHSSVHFFQDFLLNRK